MKITTEDGKSLSATRVVEVVLRLLGERRRLREEIREKQANLSPTNMEIVRGLVNWHEDKNEILIEEAFMKTEQSYDRMVKALLEMKKNFEDQIHSLEHQLNRLSEHIVRANVDDLRHVFEQQKVALTECAKGIDQKIVDCVAGLEEYTRMYSDLRALKERLHELGVESIEMPELIPIANLGGMIEARIQRLAAQSSAAAKIGGPDVEAAKSQPQAARISQDASDTIEIATNKTERVAQPSAPVSGFEQEAVPQAGGEKTTVPTEFFDYLTRAATEAIGPMAQRVVRDQIGALGESRDAFPQTRLRELVDLVSREILNETMRLRFQNMIVQQIYSLKSLRG